MDDLEKRMDLTGYPLWEQTDKRYDIIKNNIKKLRNKINKRDKINLLKGNIGPFGFSSIEIQPAILFISNNESIIETIQIGYSDLVGERTETLKRRMSYDYQYEKPIILERKGIFPFDKYRTQIYIKMQN